jgi:hypothetical protein
MKKLNALCIAAALLTGNLFAAPVSIKKNPQLGHNKISNLAFAKKKKGGNWEEGNMLFALGYGFPNFGKTLLTASEDEINWKATGFGPMHFRFEYALSETWGIGLSSNFNKFGYSYDDQSQTGVDANGNPVYTTYNYKYDWTAINFLVRFNKHWAAGSRADIFSGTGIGYNHRVIKYTSTDPNAVEESFDNILPIGFESTIGVRIFFTPNIAGYIEAGWAKDILQAGICYKI